MAPASTALAQNGVASRSSPHIAKDSCCFGARRGARSSSLLGESWSRRSFAAGASVQHSRRRPLLVISQASAAATTDTEAFTALNDLPSLEYINSEGRIQPPVEPGTAASVFAVLDNNNRVQYIGFSKDIRNSLRTLIGRRPELCHHYKLLNLPALDQPKMLAIRQQWINELGFTPRGNSDASQRRLWEQPGDAGSLSDRGKASAAASRAKTLMQMLQDKGLKEEMVYNPALLEEGKCDILPTKDLTAEEAAAAAKGREEEASKRKSAKVTAPNGAVIEFEIFYEMKFPTNGGWMYEILVTFENKETRHRVILGRMYPEAAEISEDAFLETTMAFLLHKGIVRHTEGLRASSVFPINYFAAGQVQMRFDDFKDWFAKPLPDDHWHAKRINSYGPAIDTDIVGPDEAAEDDVSSLEELYKP